MESKRLALLNSPEEPTPEPITPALFKSMFNRT